MIEKTVFISQEGKFNYTSAKCFGNLKSVTNKEYNIYLEESLNNSDILEDIGKCVSIFDPINDSILVSGDPIVFGILLHRLLFVYQFVYILKWDRELQNYFRTIIKK